MDIIELKNLGPKSQEQLAIIGVATKQDLEAMGAVHAYLKLKDTYPRLSLNMLYAMEGALQNIHCIDLRKSDKVRLLAELDALEQAKKHLEY